LQLTGKISLGLTTQVCC